MAFTVEDGNGITDSNSYATVTAATAYHAERGNTAWAALSSGSAQIALIRGSQAVDHIGEQRFPGTRSSLTQGLLWPRDDAYDLEGNELTSVPTAVLFATYEAALIEAADPGALSPSLERGGMTKRELVVGAVEVEYFNGAIASTNYTTVTRALMPVLGGAGIRTVRV